MIKRLLDFCFSFVSLIVLLPLFLFIAFIVWLTSPGPVFFKQQRIGLHGVPFYLFKFRTMKWAPHNQGALITQENDDRITWFGAYLRMWKLDELPQLFNVLRGEMSFVGPRPEVDSYVSLYPESDRSEILSVRPGITGRTQLAWFNEEEILSEQEIPERYYEQVILPQKIKSDIAYVRNKGNLHDVAILLRTLSMILQRILCALR